MSENTAGSRTLPEIRAALIEPTQPHLADSARAVLRESNWNVIHHWKPNDVDWRDVAFSVEMLLDSVRPGRPTDIPVETAQALLHLHGHRPWVVVDLAASWLEYSHRSWAVSASNKDLLDLLTYEATGISWRCAENCYTEHDMPREEIRAFALALDGHAFNTCYRAGLTRPELNAITAAGNVDAVAPWASIEMMAALRDPEEHLLLN